VVGTEEEGTTSAPARGARRPRPSRRPERRRRREEGRRRGEVEGPAAGRPWLAGGGGGATVPGVKRKEKP
jgi:hypothetical protein